MLLADLSGQISLRVCKSLAASTAFRGHVSKAFCAAGSTDVPVSSVVFVIKQ